MSWMSLKSSEMNNCSWNISAVLISSFLLLLLLPSMLSNDHRTNKVLMEIDSEENPWSSRIELLRRLLVVLFESVEEDWLLSSKSRTQNINPLSFIGMMLGKSTGSLLCGFAFAFDLAAKTFAISCDACSSGRSAGTSVSLLFESITNLFDPWEILTQDWELSFDFNSLFTAQIIGCDFQYGPILAFPWIHPFGCDDSSFLGRVYSRQALA